MGASYDGEHAIVFEPVDNSTDAVNTWTDWYLIPTSRPTMTMPGAQNRFVEVPGMNGSYDLSNYLTPDVVYQDRSGSFEFIVDNDHENWLSIYRKIAVFLHGRRLKMILTDDPNWYYLGRFTLNEWKSDQARSSVSISYRVDPFKYSIYPDYTENVIWDTFCFERDYDWSQLWHIEVNDETKEIEILASGFPSVLKARMVSEGNIGIAYGTGSVGLTAINQEVTIGKSSASANSVLRIVGTGIIDIGFQKISM